MDQYVYPVTLTPDEEAGGFVVTFRDLPEAITQGDSLEEALSEAADCLEEAFAGRIVHEEPFPTPSLPEQGDFMIAVPTQTALKAAIHQAVSVAGISKVELAKRLGVDEKEARRILDPKHRTRLPLMERALAAVGKRCVVSVQDAA
ncbi:MAG: type II toxin-antitoxin system HicB family antitoxin [Magnetococcales bacterium]|nr:type II toxin-antitoxin system HicB family antitoxin [Magnetococcales bacterium]